MGGNYPRSFSVSEIQSSVRSVVRSPPGHHFHNSFLHAAYPDSSCNAQVGQKSLWDRPLVRSFDAGSKSDHHVPALNGSFSWRASPYWKHLWLSTDRLSGWVFRTIGGSRLDQVEWPRTIDRDIHPSWYVTAEQMQRVKCRRICLDEDPNEHNISYFKSLWHPRVNNRQCKILGQDRPINHDRLFCPFPRRYSHQQHSSRVRWPHSRGWHCRLGRGSSSPNVGLLWGVTCS